MTLYSSFHDPISAKAGTIGDFSHLEFSDADGAEVTIYTKAPHLHAAMHEMAQVFNMRAKDSQFSGMLDLLDLLMTVVSDPNRDTIANLARAVQIHAVYCCEVCGRYRPDMDGEWRDLDGRAGCDDCEAETGKDAELSAEMAGDDRAHAAIDAEMIAKGGAK